MTTVYQNCVKMLENVPKGETITLPNLRTLIQRHIGGQEVTIMQALRTMGETGLIKDLGNARFKVLKDV